VPIEKEEEREALEAAGSNLINLLSS